MVMVMVVNEVDSTGEVIVVTVPRSVCGIFKCIALPVGFLSESVSRGCYITDSIKERLKFIFRFHRMVFLPSIFQTYIANEKH